MSRRLATVLRVAALQETLARAEAGRAGAAVHEAVALVGEREAALAATRLVAGTPAQLQQRLAVQGLRARAVGAAQAGVDEAEAARRSALEGWSRTRARHRLLEELDARVRAEEQAAEIAAAQKLADDLSGARRGTDGR